MIGQLVLSHIVPIRYLKALIGEASGVSREPAQITQLLAASRKGDDGARDRLWSIVYDHLRSLARKQLSAESARQTLQPTALVHEAYVKLLGGGAIDWQSRCHFYAAAARVMRRIRIDAARAHKCEKRGGDRHRIALEKVDARRPLNDLRGDAPDPADDLALEEALCRLEQIDKRMADVVTLRYFGGLSREDVSGATDIAPRTVDLLWGRARTWLARELADER